MRAFPSQALSELAVSIDYGLTASARNGDGPRFLRITDLQNDSVDWSAVPSCDCSEEDAKKFALSGGDIVFARTGATTGKSYLITSPPHVSVFASYLIRVRAKESVFPLFLAHFFKSQKYWRQISSLSEGAAQPGVNATKLGSLQIPVPPLDEQKRIATILNKADSLRRKRQQAIRLADDLLRAAFLDMFGDPVTNPKGWQVVKLGELAKSDRYAIKAGPFGSALKKECYVSSGYRIYGQEQVIRDDLTFGDYYINEDKYRELESCKVESGDMLISLVGTFGKICIVPPEFEPGIINPRLMKVSFDPLKATPRFMKALLTSDPMVRKIESLSHGGTMGIVNVGIMKELEIPVPPVAIQIRFEEVQQKLATLKANYDAAEEQTTSAFSALQSRYFS
ncbi:MAG: restriction endonuclease subunit S [Azonexus sp.]|nr:restriction endonuclease subunit S [Azonexus sp.]